MKKLIIAFSIACACATGAFADSAFDRGKYEQWQTPWFNGIGYNATTSSLDPTNGTWTLPSSGYKIEDQKLVLDGSQDVSFTIGNAYAVDSSTIVEVTATAKFAPVLPTDLTIPTDAKVAFAVVKDGSDLSYRAWVAGQADWTTLSDLGTAETEEEVTVLIQLNYRTSVATFSVNGTASETTIAIPANTANPTGFSITGCGTVTSVDGEIQYHVAKIDDTGYATLGDAIDAAHEDETVSVVRETEQNVTLPTETKITIADNGKVKGDITVPSGAEVDVKPTYEEMSLTGGAGKKKGESGIYYIDCKMSGDGTVNVVLPAVMEDYKETAGAAYHSDKGVAVEVRTKDSILEDATLYAYSSELQGLNITDEFRDYLTTNLAAYVAAQANAADIETGLKAAKPAAEGGNGFKLYEAFLLNIATDTEVKIMTPPAGDTSTEAIGIAFPYLVRSEYSTDYRLRCKINDDDKPVTSGIIPVPLETGNYVLQVYVDKFGD